MSSNSAYSDVHLNILVLEDSLRDFEVMCDYLDTPDFVADITRVETRDGFLQAVTKSKYDVILSDFMLPGFDAIGALKDRNEHCAETPFICISGSIGEERAIELLKLGAVDYVSKDRMERLPYIVKRAIDEAQEVKARKQAEQELIENYSLLRIAGYTARIGGWSVDLRTEAVSWSDVVADIHELPHGYSLRLVEMFMYFTPDCRSILRSAWDQCVRYGHSFDEEAEIVTHLGKHVYVRVIGEAVFDENGNIIKVQGAYQDISERMHNMRELHETNQRLIASQQTMRGLLEDLNAENRSRREREDELQKVTMAIEQAGEVIVITDPHGIIQYVNPAFEQISGYTRDEAIGRSTSILKSGKHDKAFYKEMWEILESGKRWHGRFINKHKNGRLYTEEASISPVCDALGRVVSYVAVKRDITLQEELTAQLYQAQKMESVGRLAGGVAHDYNNMLSIILGYTELAMSRIKKEDPLFDDLSEIHQAAKRSSEITHQLLAFARKQTVKPIELDLNDSVSGMLKMLKRLIGEDIQLDWIPDLNLKHVKIDPSQVNQIMANLCVNARDAIRGVGQIVITTQNVNVPETVGDNIIQSHPYVMLSVSDNGCGMDVATLEHIFEPFFTTKDLGEGTGLGLATVYGIVQQNGGRIEVESVPDTGTTFKIYLPQQQCEVNNNTKSVKSAPTKGQGETILLVEDEPSLLSLAERLLQRLGYNVLSASGPLKALRLTDDYHDDIHLLLTDVIMPDMNGCELAEKLIVKRPQLKCLFMSGYPADVIAHQGVLEEGVQFIQKPLSIHDLADKVRQVLSS